MAEQGNDERQLVVFQLGDEVYGVNIGTVRESLGVWSGVGQGQR